MFLAFCSGNGKGQSSLPLENFFSRNDGDPLCRYTPGIKILLARHAIFSLFILLFRLDAGRRLEGITS